MSYLNLRAINFNLPASTSRAGILMLMLALTACGGGDVGNLNSTVGISSGSAEAKSRVFTTRVAEPKDYESDVVACKDSEGNTILVKPKTITIYNNTEETIYPALVTSTNSVNQWIQGCFRTQEPYPTNLAYKLYVNEGAGIPKDSSVEITLPLFSMLPTEQYITWWNGGRVLLGDNNEGLRKKEDLKIPTPDAVRCKGTNTKCQLSTYSSAVGFPENVYAQLSEYTFGDSIEVAGQPTRLLKPENVGYNISYVDHVYLPVAIGPKNNPYIGYSGSTQPIAQFREHLASFLNSSTGVGWPVYNMNQLKLPGGYNIFAQRFGLLEADAKAPARAVGVTNPPLLTALSCQQGRCTDEEKKNLQYGAAVQRMQNLFGSCVAWEGEDVSKYVTENLVCPQDLKDRLSAIKQFFAQNHKQYLKLHVKDGTCKSITPEIPNLNYFETLKHVYGWVPFNDGCGAGDNPLKDTAIPRWTHQQIQDMFIDDLQYNHEQPAVKNDPKLTFNPYVKLIHDDLQMNAYAFSVDDAVGFMSELGDGLIFTVAGARGLENQKQFEYKNGFSVAIGDPTPDSVNTNEPIPGPNAALIKKYGVCVFNQDQTDMNCNNIPQGVTMPVNSKILGFRVGTVNSYPIKVRFTDFKDNVYTFDVNKQFADCPTGTPLPQCPTNRADIKASFDMSCSVVNSTGIKHIKSKEWCDNANPNQQRDKQLTKNYLSFPMPVDFLGNR